MLLVLTVRSALGEMQCCPLHVQRPCGFERGHNGYARLGKVCRHGVACSAGRTTLLMQSAMRSVSGVGSWTHHGCATDRSPMRVSVQ